MADYLDSVKGLVAQYRVWEKNSAKKGEADQAAKMKERGDNITSLITEVEDYRRTTQPIPSSYGDLSDLPDELIKELSGIKVDDLEQQLFTIIKSGGAEVDLDAILIELFRRFKVIQTRKFLQNKLWRMVQKGVIHSVAGKKGVYAAELDWAGEPVKPEMPQPPQDDPFGEDDDVPF